MFCSIRFSAIILFLKRIFQKKSATQSKIRRSKCGKVPSHCAMCEVSMPSLSELVLSLTTSEKHRMKYQFHFEIGWKQNNKISAEISLRSIQFKMIFNHDKILNARLWCDKVNLINNASNNFNQKLISIFSLQSSFFTYRIYRAIQKKKKKMPRNGDFSDRADVTNKLP